MIGHLLTYRLHLFVQMTNHSFIKVTHKVSSSKHDIKRSAFIIMCTSVQTIVKTLHKGLQHLVMVSGCVTNTEVPYTINIDVCTCNSEENLSFMISCFYIWPMENIEDYVLIYFILGYVGILSLDFAFLPSKSSTLTVDQILYPVLC